VELKTTILPKKEKSTIDLTHKVIAMGSCFALTIGNKLTKYKFKCLVNPFGTLYDPLSIFRWLTYTMTNTLPSDDTYQKHNEIFCNLETHSSFSALSEQEVRLKIEGSTGLLRDKLLSADWLILTLGTSFIHQYKATEKPVANCHKIPAKQFDQRLLTIEEVICSWDKVMNLIMKHRPNLNIMFTVSPVRHLRYGLVNNSVSKALLRLFCHQASLKYTHVFYYPAFELMIDDLRDYRFYSEDLLHPSSMATEYIWEHFSRTFFNQQTLTFVTKWTSILKALQHKPFIPSSKSHQVFVKKLIEDLNELEEYIDVSGELAQMKKQLI